MLMASKLGQTNRVEDLGDKGHCELEECPVVSEQVSLQVKDYRVIRKL